MDNRSLVLLGLLMVQSQHGYQINEFIENNLSFITDMKKPTAYAALERLSQKGLIEVQTEQEGNRPPRKVYTINEEGKLYFYQLLLKNLSSAEQLYFQGDIGLVFLDHLPVEKALPALQKRKEEFEKLLLGLKNTPAHCGGVGVNLAIQHKQHMLEAEVQFLSQALQQMDNKLNPDN